MNLIIEGRPTPRSHQRCSSAKKHSVIPDGVSTLRNPITGLRTATPRGVNQVDRAPTHRSAKPDSIPALDLKFLSKDPEETYKLPELSDIPDTASTISWGTARTATDRFLQQNELCLAIQPAKKDERKDGCLQQVKSQKICARDEVPVPDDLVAPSTRYQALYKKYAEDMKQSYQNHISVQAPMSRQSAVPVSRDTQTHAHSAPGDESGCVAPSCPTTHATVHKKLDAEALMDFKKKQKLIETVMIDQLSRSVLSDPEQNERASHRAHTPGMSRGAIRTMHDSKVSTRATATEHLLSKRVRFGARILSRNGVDAVKELTGFYFHIDQSMTIYEYRQFGKRAKALPFIARGRYSHVRGHNCDRVYRLTDIYAGVDLEFLSANQHSLPQRMQDDEVVVFRVTDVDDDEKRAILLAEVRWPDREQEYVKLHMPSESEVIEARIAVLHIQNYSRDLLKMRGVRTVMGVRGECELLDQTSCGRLARYDLEKLIIKYRIDPQPGMLETVLIHLDHDGSGYLDWSEFLRAIIGEMSERRKLLVRRAFLKIDCSRRGEISFSDVRKFFCTRKNLSLESGRDGESVESFLESFAATSQYETISYGAFESYYEGLSLAVESDDAFISTLRNTWGI